MNLRDVLIVLINDEETGIRLSTTCTRTIH